MLMRLQLLTLIAEEADGVLWPMLLMLHDVVDVADVTHVTHVADDVAVTLDSDVNAAQVLNRCC
jgi:hypothetical protein